MKHVGPYECGRTIGSGASSTVKEGKHTKTGEKVAIKIITKMQRRKRLSDALFEAEVSAMKVIQHPHLVSLHNVLRDDKVYYMVLEWAQGGDLLDQVSERNDQDREDFAKMYFKQLIEGLQCLHSHGVAHRDLKLENLLLDGQGKLKIADFGMARLFEDPDERSTMKTFCGTEDYMAPEVLAGESYDGCAADVWSAGVILFCMLTGTFPFDDNRSLMEVKYSTPKGFPQGAKEILKSIFVRDPSRRTSLVGITHFPWFQSANDSSQAVLSRLAAAAHARVAQHESGKTESPKEKMLRASLGVVAQIKVVKAFGSATVKGSVRDIRESSFDRLAAIIGLTKRFSSRDGRQIDWKGIKASAEYQRHLEFMKEVGKGDLKAVSMDELVPLYINLWNLLFLNSCVEYAAHPSQLSRSKKSEFFGMEHSVAFELLSLDDILHGLLRHNAVPNRKFSFRPQFGKAVPSAIKKLMVEPVVVEALLCLSDLTADGMASQPLFTSRGIDGVKSMAEAYLQENMSIDSSSGEVTLPWQVDSFKKDFGNSYHSRLEKVATILGKSPSGIKLRAMLQYGTPEFLFHEQRHSMVFTPKEGATMPARASKRISLAENSYQSKEPSVSKKFSRSFSMPTVHSGTREDSSTPVTRGTFSNDPGSNASPLSPVNSSESAGASSPAPGTVPGLRATPIPDLQRATTVGSITRKELENPDSVGKPAQSSGACSIL